MATSIATKRSSVPEFLQGGGELGEYIRTYDWKNTALGPVETWPQSLRTCVRIMLTSRQPIWIGWGKELIKLYNDPYKEIVGGKHPWALGKPASVVWKDIWREIDPMLRQVMEKDQGTFVESQLLIMERNGYAEETYYTFSYTPIPGDDGSTAGMICANSDDTNRIISERHLKTLTQLGKNLIDVNADEEVMERSLMAFRDNTYDFPFALFYRVINDQAVLFESTNVVNFPGENHRTIELSKSNNDELSAVFQKTLLTAKIQMLNSLSQFVNIPTGIWERAPESALILPISHAGSKEVHSFLLVGCNPFQLMSEKYLSFFALVADQISTSMDSVHAREEERQRTEALAELDRAKTTFFSNISHEFRTPLTLLLGPINDTLNSPETNAGTKDRMEVAYRNALRLQRMVTTLLEFSKIESGKMDGKFARVDIARFTADLASSFRSAIEKAGMQLIVLSSPINKEVYVDIEMWERIVLNLMSNAFKYSKEGTIKVEIKQEGSQVQLSVADTGIGIPADQLEKVFDRFHRIEHIEGRSKEGTGIGLAMVKELVKFHNGSIQLKSQVGLGSTFTVLIPLGKAHIPEGKVIEHLENPSVSLHSNSIIQEAGRWVSSETPVEQFEIREEESILSVTEQKKYKVLLADDNADMRDYVKRLLDREFNVITAWNGEDAFNKMLKHKPDLLLSDVMMPKLDGFGLLKMARANSEVKNTPIILLSARAGDEAKIEGLNAGADDYLVKPFSSKELIARIDANIKIARNRLAAEKNLKSVIMQSPVAMCVMKGESLVLELVNDRALKLWGKKYEEVINKPILKSLPELVEQGFGKILNQVYSSGEPYIANEMPVSLIRNGKTELLYLNFIYEPLYNAEKLIDGVVGVGIDVSEHVKTRQIIQKAEERATLAIESGDLGTYEINLLTNEMITSDRFNKIWGVDRNLTRQQFQNLIHPEDLCIRQKAHAESLITGNLDYEARIIWNDKSTHWVKVKGRVFYDEDGRPVSLLGIIQDITEQKLFSENLTKLIKDRTLELQRSNEDLQQFAHVASHDLKEPVRKIKTFSLRLKDEFGEVLPEKGGLFLQKILLASDRMFAMIEGVLNYSKINALDQAAEKIDLKEVFLQIKSDLEILIQQKKAIIHISNLPVIEGAPVLIHQLFYNLINNSLKFSKSEAVPEIVVSGEQIIEDNINFAKITINDNGIGFSNEYRERIFDTFSRLNSKDHYEGTGLGLSLCKKIVERHKGKIAATAEKEKGATFTVYLPVKISAK